MSNILAMDPTVERWYVPKADRSLPENEQMRLKYRNLTAKEDAELSDNTIKSITTGKIQKSEILISSIDLKRCEKTIKGWEVFKYAADHPTKAGQDVPFSVDNIGFIPQNVRREYIDFITGRDQEEKELGEAKTE